MSAIIEPTKVILDFKKIIVKPYTRKKQVKLSELKDYCAYPEAAEKILSEGRDPIIYEYYEYGPTETSGNINFGLTVIYPGKIGKEYYMTKGHFHEKDGAELYLCLKGRGILLMQNKEGKAVTIELEPGSIGYVPVGWGHRTINIGRGKFVFFFAYPSDAGHDYMIVKEKGFSKIVIEEGKSLKIIDNPRYRGTSD
ncbi:MAG: glucose-6-phosphate isomerase [Aigarchaeota archaeon]|nr:glucose-6-phosphate isomerase [Aigarchaeota archaeon]MCX8193233.1 glucose-6-phosphate isomerase [Nitrososphaeria archaeon]MDW7986374.1 glucose-6-phosphate isomerase family protein [Nitrososphaerota archaeon]